MTINQKIQALRAEMKKHNLDAYIIPSSDPHISEYAAPRWLSREWISGFTGSAGTVIVTQDHAGVWTDSRYFLQAEEELQDSEFVLHKMINQFKPYHIEWLTENLSSGMVIGFDGEVQTQSFFERLTDIFSKKNITINSDHDLIDFIWQDRPEIPLEPIFEHDIVYAGATREEKISAAQDQMSDSDYLLIPALDEIAWLYNIRGRDVESNPVAVAYAIIGKSQHYLFTKKSKVSAELKAALQIANVEVVEYDQIYTWLSSLQENVHITIDKKSCNNKLFQSIGTSNITDKSAIVKHLKAVKNETELKHFPNAMIKDGVALTHAFYWLEQSLASGHTFTEYDFAMKLAECRSKQDGYYGESFNAIIGYNSNGAVIHYRPMPDTAKTIKPEGLLLVDSGGQYLDGTTDITRTIALSEPTEEQKLHYTCVLKGHIALDRAVFPKGTTGGQLDILARQHLWQHGLNYLHGTGHGIGFFLNVHEPPQGFAPGTSERATTAHKVGMVSTNEPGYYQDGSHGIRIENVVVTTENEQGYLYHNNITLFPIDMTPVDYSMLNAAEVQWINDYHTKVYDTLSSHLSEELKSWLKDKCAKI